MPFGEVLKRLRKDKRLTQAELARLTGLKVSAISMYENGNREPNFETLEIFADFFNVDMDVLLGREKKSDTTNISPAEENKKAPARKGNRIPVLGRVAAGIPIEAVQDIEDYEEMYIPALEDPHDYFALRIVGHSMEPRIWDGDVVIVHKQSDVDSGQIAVVLVNGDDATVKQIKKSDAGLTLIGLNPTVYSPHFYTADEVNHLPVRILGAVCEVRGKI